VIVVCTLGSALNRPDLATWGAYLAPLERIYALYDADRAGQAGLQVLQALSERVQPVRLPPGAKDMNEYFLQGGDLWQWLKGVVEGERDTL
jgi:DNA primase